MENKEKTSWVGEFGALERVSFLSDLLNKQVEIRNMLDLRTNIMIGFNSALIIFFAASFKGNLAENLLLILFLGVIFISMLFALMALKPSHFVTKKGQEDSLFYHHKICSKDHEEYHQEIFAALKNEDKIYDAYVLEVYNLTRYSNIPRKFYLNWSIRSLFYGSILAVVIYIIYLIIVSVFATV